MKYVLLFCGSDEDNLGSDQWCLCDTRCGDCLTYPLALWRTGTSKGHDRKFTAVWLR
jgi:hypothetical protein